VERLPSWGHYKSELARDEDWAEAILAQMEAGEDIAPAADPNQITQLNYTPEVGFLSVIADRLLLLRSAVYAAAGGGQEEPINLLPRPKSALETAREQRVIDELLDIERQIFGGGLAME
jgi:hypothetical protein